MKEDEASDQFLLFIKGTFSLFFWLMHYFYFIFLI